MPNIFLFDNFFEKSGIFGENCEKQFCGRIRQFFREREASCAKNGGSLFFFFFFITNENRIFYYLAVSSKEVVIFKENGKKLFWGPI